MSFVKHSHSVRFVTAYANTELTYQNLALNIASLFCSVESIVRETEFLKLMAAITALLPSIDVTKDQ